MMGRLIMAKSIVAKLKAKFQKFVLMPMFFSRLKNYLKRDM
jgi:hypothetical protein